MQRAPSRRSGPAEAALRCVSVWRRTARVTPRCASDRGLHVRLKAPAEGVIARR